MIVPFGDDDYYRNRPTLSIAAPGKGKDAAVRIDDFYGFHPKMEVLSPIFKEGRLGIVQGVGSDNTSGSHFEAQDQIEHGERYGVNIGGGWLGRHLRSRSGGGDSPLSRPSQIGFIASGNPCTRLARHPPVRFDRSMRKSNCRCHPGDPKIGFPLRYHQTLRRRRLESSAGRGKRRWIC